MTIIDHDGTTTDFLSGGGEMGTLIRRFDWSRTSLGPLEAWPACVTVTIGTILGTSVPILTLWGDDGYMIYNDAYAAFAGGRHPALLGVPVREGWPEVAGFNDRAIKMVLAGGSLTYRDQEMELNRSGVPEQVWLSVDYSPVLDEQGVPIGVISIVSETTARILAERELKLESAQREAERNRQRRMFEQAPGFVTVMRGPDHVVEFVNQMHRELFDSADWVGRSAREAIPSIDGQGFFEALDSVYSTGETIEVESVPIVYRRTPDSAPEHRFITLMYSPAYDDAGTVDGVFCLGFEVTEITRAANRRSALAVLGERIREIDSPSEMAFAAAEIAGQQLGGSRAGFGLINAMAETITIESDWSRDGLPTIAGKLDFRDFGSFIDNLLRNEMVICNDVRTDPRTADKAGPLEAIQARAFVNLPVMEHGQLVAVLYVDDDQPREWSSEDLSFLQEVAERTRTAVERRRAEAAERDGERRFMAELEAKVAERTAALQQAQKMEAIGQLTGGVAHDFNNLLMAVSGSVELLRKRVPDDPALYRLIDNALEATRRGSSLTKRMLAFARRQELKSERVDLEALVEDMRELLGRSLGPMINIQTRFESGLGMVEIDPGQLESALLNLIVNARDALNGQGNITIAGRAEVVGRGHALEPGNYVCLTVRDEGEGMDEATLKRATEPFFTTKGVGKGSGLGLSMVLGFAEQSGGTLRLISQPGGGTTAEIWLRASTVRHEPAAAPVPVQEAVPDSTRPLHVLAVDDDALVLMNTVAMLEDLGHAATAAYSGREALEAMRSYEFDLVLTDHAMPQMTGAQLASEIRHRAPSMPIVLATGYAELPPGPGQTLPKLSKPFSIADLAAALNRATAYRRGAA